MAMRWGIIGLGDIVERNMVQALALAADSELVAVMSRSMDKAKSFAARHKVARAYDSLDKMLADPQLDVVYIATPRKPSWKAIRPVSRSVVQPTTRHRAGRPA